MREIALRSTQRIDRAIASETVKRGRSSFLAWIGIVKSSARAHAVLRNANRTQNRKIVFAAGLTCKLMRHTQRLCDATQQCDAVGSPSIGGYATTNPVIVLGRSRPDLEELLRLASQARNGGLT